MRRLILYLAVALVTFGSSVTVTRIWMGYHHLSLPTVARQELTFRVSPAKESQRRIPQNLAYLKDWIGRYPIDKQSKLYPNIYQHRQLRPRLEKLLGDEIYRHLVDDYYVMTPIEVVDDYLIIRRCERHNCPNDNLVAINLYEGDIHVAFFNDGDAEWYHTKGKVKDLPNGVFKYLWWMQSPDVFNRLKEITKDAI
jgi:hypothetical protein